MVVVSWVALGGDAAKSVLGVQHQRRRNLVGRVGSRCGFVRLITACRAFARDSAGVSHCVPLARDLGSNWPVLRQLAGGITDANKPAAASEKSHCRRR